MRAEGFDSHGLPIEGAIVDLSIADVESITMTSGASDASGIAEAEWVTERSNTTEVDVTGIGVGRLVCDLGLLLYMQ